MLISKWKNFSAEGIALGERLNVQNRPKRCLFLSVAKPILAKVHTVQIVKSNLSVYQHQGYLQNY